MNIHGGRILQAIVALMLLPGIFWPGPAAAGPQPVPPPPVRPPLVIEEYRVVDLDRVDISSFELPMELPDEIIGKRATWREQSNDDRLASANARLKPFGYRYVAQRGDWEGNASLYRGSALVAANAGLPYRIAVSDTGSDFAMVIDNTPNVRPFQLLVNKAGAVPWDAMKHALTLPAFHGDALLVLDADIGAEPVDDLIPFRVRRNGAVIYEDFMPPVLVENPMKGLWGWDGHWVVEVAERIIWDGYDITQLEGIEKAYEFSVIRNQPFYFYEKEGRVSISYATWDYPVHYDEVWHYRCCGDSLFNPYGNDRMVAFWARKDHAWWYVEAGIYD
jgi:hypothetical protein